MGSDLTESSAISELKRENIIEHNKDISLTGFWIPDRAGKYKSRVYLAKSENFKEIKNPVFVCVYYEKKLGKELTWTRMVPITVR